MRVFVDTSFLFAFYFPRSASEQAFSKVETLTDPPLISSLVRYEFHQAVWFKVWLQTQGQPAGLSEAVAMSTLAAFDLDLEQGLWAIAIPDWEQVFSDAKDLTVAHTPRHGARSMDILHVASALQLGASELLSFDENQLRVARAAGLSSAV